VPLDLLAGPLRTIALFTPVSGVLTNLGWCFTDFH
jgi:hypothetical protein